MGHLIQKGLLCLACLLLLLSTKGIGTGLLVSGLLGLGGALLPEAMVRQEDEFAALRDGRFKKRRWLLFGEMLLAAAGGFAVPAFCCMLPLLLYDCVRVRLYVPLVLMVAAMVSAGFGGVPVEVCAACLLLAIFSGYGAVREEKLAMLRGAVISGHDTLTEHRLLQKEAARQMLLHQDNLIYTATLQERNRIAREIHDNVGHLLTRSILQVGALKVMNQSEALTPAIGQVQDTLNTAMTSMRQSVHDLHDESIDLKPAMEKLLEEAGGMQVRFEFDCGRNVPREIKYAFLAILKEGVNNAIRHSNGSRLEVLVREHPGLYRMTIADNGTKAVAADGVFVEGIGLSNIRERVAAIGGTVQFDTAEGFRIGITVMKEKKA